MNANLSALLYLVAGVLFIMSLRGLSSPASSRQGNFFDPPTHANNLTPKNFSQLMAREGSGDDRVGSIAIGGGIGGGAYGFSSTGSMGGGASTADTISGTVSDSGMTGGGGNSGSGSGSGGRGIGAIFSEKVGAGDSCGAGCAAAGCDPMPRFLKSTNSLSRAVMRRVRVSISLRVCTARTISQMARPRGTPITRRMIKAMTGSIMI